MMDKASVVRIIALIASILLYFNVNVPSEIQEYIAGAVMLFITLYTAWKNNYLSKKGKAQKEALKRKGLD